MTSFVTHLEAALDGTHLPVGQVQTIHQGRPLWVRYDLEQIGRQVSPPNLPDPRQQPLAVSRVAPLAPQC